MKVLFIGPVGSGKSTQAELLAEFLKLPFIHIGDILREVAKKDSPLGRKVLADIHSGRLVDDEVVTKIIQERTAQIDCQVGYVTDGYPRTLKQLEIYDPQFDKVFYLEIQGEEIKERLTKRGREDDTEEVIQRRLEFYHKLTQPLLRFYESQGKLIRIPAAESIEQIQTEVRENIKGETAK